MATQTQDQTQSAPAENKNSRPTHIVRKKIGRGRHVEFKTLDVAWDRGDGSLYIKPYGTQIIEGGFYVFPTQDQESGQ